MRKIDVSERPMPEINPAKVCFVIEKSRELLSEDVGVAPDASNPTDDGERAMLSDAAGHSIRRELIEFIKDLDVDESAALVALAWIGRGDFEPGEWRSAVAEASERPRARPGNIFSAWLCCPTTSKMLSRHSGARARISKPTPGRSGRAQLAHGGDDGRAESEPGNGLNLRDCRDWTEKVSRVSDRAAARRVRALQSP